MRPVPDAHDAQRDGGTGAGRPVLRCVGLIKRYGAVRAVDGLDLDVGPGECFGLLGPNGAGKTTTVEILEGLIPPDAGSVEVLGRRWADRDPRALRERIGVQLQETQLSDKLTVLETVRLFRSFSRRGLPPDEAVDRVSLGEKRRARVGALSGGQRQRLALACALVNNPEVLFLDEPTTGLDPQARLNVWDVVEAFQARGGTLLLTTHSMEEATRLCDRVAIIDHGRRIALGTPAELVASLGADQIVEVVLDGERLEPAELAGLPGVRGVNARNGALRLRVSDVGPAMHALLDRLDRRNVRLVNLTTHQASLEDVFVHLTGRGLRDD